MRKLLLMAGIILCLLGAVPTAEAAGQWVWFSHPSAYFMSGNQWGYFNPLDSQWCCNTSAGGQWSRLGHNALTNGWVYLSYPYAYSLTTSHWFYLNQSDTQWVYLSSSAAWWRLSAAATPSPTGCSCDLSKPLVVPLAQHGNETQVNQWLGAGGAPECGNSGLRDVRFDLLRPSGQTWGYAPFYSSGCLDYSADGNQVRFQCVKFEGQNYHFVGYASTEQLSGRIQAKPNTWINYVEAGHGMFAYWECR